MTRMVWNLGHLLIAAAMLGAVESGAPVQAEPVATDAAVQTPPPTANLEQLRQVEATYGPDHLLTGMVLIGLAHQDYLNNRLSIAEAHLKRAMLILERAKPDGRWLATSLILLADLYRIQGRYAAAEPLYQRGIEMLERTLEVDPVDLTIAWDALAAVQAAQTKYAEAAVAAERAIELEEQRGGPSDPALLPFLNKLAMLYAIQARDTEAEAIYDRAVEVLEASGASVDSDMKDALDTYAQWLRHHGNSEKAAAIKARANAVRESATTTADVPQDVAQ